MWYICSMNDQVRQLNFKVQNRMIQAIRANSMLVGATFVGLLEMGVEFGGLLLLKLVGTHLMLIAANGSKHWKQTEFKLEVLCFNSKIAPLWRT